jgi:hypothetical protein
MRRSAPWWVDIPRGTHLDPALVDAFLPLAPDLHAECFGEEAPQSIHAA